MWKEVNSAFCIADILENPTKILSILTSKESTNSVEPGIAPFISDAVALVKGKRIRQVSRAGTITYSQNLTECPNQSEGVDANVELTLTE